MCVNALDVGAAAYSSIESKQVHDHFFKGTGKRLLVTATIVCQCKFTCSMLLYVRRDHKDYQGRGAQDGHLDFHTAPEL